MRLRAGSAWFCLVLHRKGGGGTGGSGWGHSQGAVHIVAARLDFEKAMVATRRATPCPDCMDRLRKHHSHLAEGWFLARKAAWALSRCMATDSADINEWVWSKSQDCLLRPEVDQRRLDKVDLRDINYLGSSLIDFCISTGKRSWFSPRKAPPVNWTFLASNINTSFYDCNVTESFLDFLHSVSVDLCSKRQ